MGGRQLEYRMKCWFDQLNAGLMILEITLLFPKHLKVFIFYLL